MKPDRVLAICLLVLIILGLVFVYSSSYYRAIKRGETSTFYLLAHAKRLGIALIFFVVGYILPYDRIRKLILPVFILLVIALIATLIAGRMQFGARRSLSIISTFGLQVSEFVRIWIIFFLANFFDAHPQTANSAKGTVMTIMICLFLITLVAVQPSISMAVISLAVLTSMLILGSTKVKVIFPAIILGLTIVVIFILLFPHARHRITSFMSDPTYQVKQSLIAIGSGGLFGKGPGAGLQKFMFLPRIHNDFIFAHIAEEFGFIGTLVLFVLYCAIFLRSLSIAAAVEDDYSKILVMGLNASIFIIFLIHVGVSIGLLPPTGVPLPFISFGGWSMAANLFAIGIILQISKKRVYA